MTQMFRCCASLESIDLSTLDTSNVTNMNDLFNMWDSSAGIWISNKLSKITFGSNFDTSNVTTMRSMFAGLTELQKIDISNFNTSNVTDMYHMFNYCKSILSHISLPQKVSWKYDYQISLSTAVDICLKSWRCPNETAPPDVEILLLKYKVPIRKERSFPRTPSPKAVIYFTYRIA